MNDECYLCFGMQQLFSVVKEDKTFCLVSPQVRGSYENMYF